jgi:hypothetical protein
MLIDDNPDAKGQEEGHQTQHATDYRTGHRGLSQIRVSALEPHAEAKADFGDHESDNDCYQIDYPDWRLIKDEHILFPSFRCPPPMMCMAMVKARYATKV